jgi:hypothetical protein
VASRDEAGQRLREIVGGRLTHERAAAGAGLDHAEQLECAQRFAHRSAGDLELLGQLTLGWKLIAGAQIAALQQALDLVDDALIEPAASDRLDYGQFPPPLAIWSGGQTSRRQA